MFPLLFVSYVYTVAPVPILPPLTPVVLLYTLVVPPTTVAPFIPVVLSWLFIAPAFIVPFFIPILLSLTFTVLCVFIVLPLNPIPILAPVTVAPCVIFEFVIP